MIKRPFIIFILVIGAQIAALLWFIQRPAFAQILKTVAYRYLPKDIGIVGDFSEISVTLFPPGFSVKNPKITLGKRNIIKLPEGSSVEAERIDFGFRPFQIFSGDIRVHELTVVNGDIQLFIEKEDGKAKKKQTHNPLAKLDFHWDELFQVRAEAIALQNVKISVKEKNSPLSLNCRAESFRVGQWSGRGGLGYSLQLNLTDVRASFFKGWSVPEPIDRVKGEASVNALGLQLESLVISKAGIEVNAIGKVEGNVLEPKSLIADADLDIQGDLKNTPKMLPVFSKTLDSLQGLFAFKGKLKGNLINVLETFQVEGLFSVKKMAYQGWKADHVHAEGRWDASPSGGALVLKKATISSPELPKILGKQAGSGGKIELGAVTWNMGSTASLLLPIHFEKAHVHWLAAPVLNQIYPLDFRLNGTVGLKVSPSTKTEPWEIQADLATSLQQFQLDNQKFLQVKPLHKTFQIPKIQLDGSIVVNAAGIKPVNLVASLPHTKLRASGKIDFKTGADVYVSGPARLDDVYQIAENEVRGKGSLTCHIHGPGSRVIVDIDADVKDGYYLGLSLGDLKGRITWDDDINRLIFTGIQALKASTSYSLEGALQLGQTDTIDLGIQIGKGNIQDVIQVFKSITTPFSWFPQSLQGSATGTVKITGGIEFPKLQILADVRGKDWEYAGERFKEVQLQGGYDRGTYLISDLTAKKRNGKIEGKIAYKAADRLFDWNIETTDFTLNDLDYIAQLDVPIRGNLEIKSRGQGIEGLIRSTSEVQLDHFSVRGHSMASSQFSLKTEKGAAIATTSIMEGQAVLDAVYNFNSKETSSVHAELKQLDFSPILLLLNSKSIQDDSLGGKLSGSADLKFHSGSIEKANGTLSFSEYLLSRSGAQFHLDHPVSVNVTEGSFLLQNLVLRGKSGELNLDLQSRGGQLEGKVSGGIDTSLVEFFTPAVVQSSGTAELDFLIGGSLKEPTFLGKAKLQGASIRVSTLESPFENITGVIQLQQNILLVQNLESDVGGGRVLANGKIVLFHDRYPEISLTSELKGPKLKIYPFQYAKVSGTLDVNGREPPYLIEGTVGIESALSKEKVLNQSQKSGGHKSLQYAPPLSRQGESNFSKFKLNIAVEASREILVQNDLFRDVQIKGNLTVVNTLEAPRILGKLELVQGKMLFKDHVFLIQNAAAIFDNPTVINPRFDLTASTEVNSIKIQMYATGRPDKIKIELTSNPAMQESEILSLLAVGLTSSDARRLSATDLSAVQQGEAASLVLHSLDFNRDLEDKTGFQLQLDQSVNTQQGVSAFRPQIQADTAAAPQITIKRKLGDRLSLSAGSTMGVGTNKSNQLNLDFSVNRNLSITGTLNNFGTYTGATTDTQTTQNSAQTFQNSFGLDLRFFKRFK